MGFRSDVWLVSASLSLSLPIWKVKVNADIIENSLHIFSLKNSLRLGLTLAPFFQMRKQRHREAEQFVPGEEAGLGAGQSETKASLNHHPTLPLRECKHRA